MPTDPLACCGALMEQPLVSVILPVRNEERFIRRCLEAVCAQDYPHLEILVVDGDSEDATVDIVSEMQAVDSRIRILHNPGRWQVKALNIGFAEAKGEIIVRIDGHAIIEPDYIRAAVHHLTREEGIDTVGGVQHAVGTTPMGRAIACATNSAVAHPSPHRTAKQDRFVNAAWMGAWRRELLEQVGPWNESLPINEDYEYSYRIHKRGGKILLTLDMKAKYYCRDNLSALWKQYYAYGRGKVMMLRQHPESILPRQAVSPAFVAALFGGAVLGLVRRVPVIRYLWAAMLGVYSLLVTLQSYRLSKQDPELLLRLPVVFLTIHMAWGLGFWHELLFPSSSDPHV